MATPGDSSLSPYRWSRGPPLVARTATIHRPLGPVAYDFVKVIVVRDGSASLFSEFGQQTVKPGDVIVLGANVLAGSEPEGRITVTTIYLDTDYMLDQARWSAPRTSKIDSTRKTSPKRSTPNRRRSSDSAKTVRGC